MTASPSPRPSLTHTATILSQDRVLEVNVVFGVLYAGAYTAACLQLRGRHKKKVVGAGVLRFFFFWELVRIGVEAASHNSKHFYFSPGASTAQAIELGCFWAITAVVSIVVLLEIVAKIPQSNRSTSSDFAGDEEAGVINDERAPLLDGHGSGHGHGAKSSTKDAAQVNQRTGSTFSGFSSKVKLLWPYLWPKGHFGLQLRILLCVAILVAIRVVNVLVPLSYKKIIDRLDSRHTNLGASGDDETESFPWDDISTCAICLTSKHALVLHLCYMIGGVPFMNACVQLVVFPLLLLDSLDPTSDPTLTTPCSGLRDSAVPPRRWNWVDGTAIKRTDVLVDRCAAVHFPKYTNSVVCPLSRSRSQMASESKDRRGEGCRNIVRCSIRPRGGCGVLMQNG